MMYLEVIYVFDFANVVRAGGLAPNNRGLAVYTYCLYVRTYVRLYVLALRMVEYI